MTLIDFINYKKIEVSKDLLENSTNFIIEISDYLGLSSQSVFNKVFKKYTQKTPLEFRKEKSKNM